MSGTQTKAGVPARLVSRLQVLLDRYPRIGWLLKPARGLVRRAFLGSGYHADTRTSYDRWVYRYDTLRPRDDRAMAAYVRRLRWRPTLSVLLVVCDPEAGFLRRTIESVLAQVYVDWELCIVDDASSDPHVLEILGHPSLADSRVKVAFRSERGGTCVASNEAAALASGSYLGFLGQEDVLRPHSLLLVADELNRHPEALLVYSDEDELDSADGRTEHRFKPDWNLALLRSQNYIGHFAVVERERFQTVGGLRPGYEGGESWDLLLRVTEGVAPERIRHVPHVLYHRRGGAGWAAQNGHAEAATQAGYRAVEDALARAGVPARVTTVHDAYQRVHYEVPKPSPRVDVVVPSTGEPELLGPCLKGLLEQTRYDELRVTVAIDRSALEIPARRDLLASNDDGRLRLFVYDDRPFNYSWVNNQAIGELDAPLVLLLNDDIRVIHADWLERMVGHLLQPGVAAAGAMLYFPDETIQHAGVIVGVGVGVAGGGVAMHREYRYPRGTAGYCERAWCDQDLSCVTAGCMLLRREVFNAVGGFDEQLAVGYNDVDLCLRIVEAGWRIIWTPSAELYHHESVSIGAVGRRINQARQEGQLMRERWGQRLDADPYYNANLSLTSMDALAFPPRATYPWRSSPAAS